MPAASVMLFPHGDAGLVFDLAELLATVEPHVDSTRWVLCDVWATPKGELPDWLPARLQGDQGLTLERDDLQFWGPLFLTTAELEELAAFVHQTIDGVVAGLRGAGPVSPHGPWPVTAVLESFDSTWWQVFGDRVLVDAVASVWPPFRDKRVTERLEGEAHRVGINDEWRFLADDGGLLVAAESRDQTR